MAPDEFKVGQFVLLVDMKSTSGNHNWYGIIEDICAYGNSVYKEPHLRIRWHYPTNDSGYLPGTYPISHIADLLELITEEDYVLHILANNN